MRNSVVNAAEIASYDQYKQIVTQQFGLPNNTGTHIICAFGAGLNATIVGSPVDVLKTRMMSRDPSKGGNVFTIIGSTLRNEGVGAFYKGFSANFMRLGCWNTVMFVTLEQVKKFFVK